MNIKLFAGPLCAVLTFMSTQLNASLISYTDLASFMADTNTSLINFENIVDHGAISPPADFVEINNIVFTTDPQTASARIFGKEVGNTDSALFVANNGNSIVIDLAGAGPGLTAAGGIFGDYNGPAGQQVQFRIHDSSGSILDQVVSYGDMRSCTGLQCEPKTFFGWVSAGGAEITRIELISDIRFSALDDFRYGAVVPVPAAVWLFGSGLVGLMLFARRK